MTVIPFLRTICMDSVILPSSGKYGAFEILRMSAGCNILRLQWLRNYTAWIVIGVVVSTTKPTTIKGQNFDPVFPTGLFSATFEHIGNIVRMFEAPKASWLDRDKKSANRKRMASNTTQVQRV